MALESAKLDEGISSLVMILRKPNQEGWWLIDLITSCSHSLHVTEFAKLCSLRPMLIICPEAKAAIRELNIVLEPHLRWLCLNTVKKLLAKSFATIDVPNFENENRAIAWAQQATKSALQKISEAKLAELVALECQVIPATIAMERAGLPFDKDRWQEALHQFALETQSLKGRLEKYLVKSSGFALFGPEPLDLNNAAAVKEGLEKLLGTKLTGTSQSSLKNYDHEAVKLLLRYREQSRMLSTYGENFLSKIKDNRIHASFEPLGSASGRFSCHKPNLQALPNDRAFQACIKSPSPYQLINFDYGAFELRILAALSGDRHLLAIFRDGQDIHSMVAEAIFKVTVSKNENAHLREQAKMLNFGIVYGMGERALAEQLRISQSAATTMMKGYFERYKEVKEFLLSLEKSALDSGYVNTALGRRLFFAKNENDENSLRRIARNMPIQGTGADIAKLALCRVFSRLRSAELDARIVNMVHDELVIESHEDISDELIVLVKFEMNVAFNAILPDIAADVGVVIS